MEENLEFSSRITELYALAQEALTRGNNEFEYAMILDLIRQVESREISILDALTQARNIIHSKNDPM